MLLVVLAPKWQQHVGEPSRPMSKSFGRDHERGLRSYLSVSANKRIYKNSVNNCVHTLTLGYF